MMTQNADKKREQIQMFCMDDMVSQDHLLRIIDEAIDLNVMTRQCLSRRIVDISLLRQELAAWESDRNEHTACIQWQFTTDKARPKLMSLYSFLL